MRIWEDNDSKCASDFDISCKHLTCILHKLFVLILHHRVTFCCVSFCMEKQDSDICYRTEKALYMLFSQTDVSCTRISKSKASHCHLILNIYLQLIFETSMKKVATDSIYSTGVASPPLVIVISRGSSLWPDVMGRHYFPFVIHTWNRNGRNWRLIMIEKVGEGKERVRQTNVV